MFEISDSVPQFSIYDSAIEEHWGFCNPQLYLEKEQPTPIFYTFDAASAAEMEYYTLSNEQKELRHPEDEEFYNLAIEKGFNDGYMLHIKDDIVQKDVVRNSMCFNALNDDLHQYIRKFFDQIESITNLQFIDAREYGLQTNQLNMAFAELKGNGPINFHENDLSAITLPSHNITFPGAVILATDINSSNYKVQIIKNLKHQILVGLCENHPSFDNSKDELQYRSMVEDSSTSFSLWKSCMDELGSIYYLKCAIKFGYHPAHINENDKNFQSFNRCLESNVDKKCIHTPNNLTPMDVKHLQTTFGISKKETDPSGFREKFKEKYPEYIVESCSSDNSKTSNSIIETILEYTGSLFN